MIQRSIVYVLADWSEQSLKRLDSWFKLRKTKCFPSPFLCFLLASLILAKLNYSSPVYSTNLFTITFEMAKVHHLKQIQNSTSYRLCSLPLYSSQKVEKLRPKSRLGISLCFWVWNPPSVTLVSVVTPRKKNTQCSWLYQVLYQWGKISKKQWWFYLKWAYILLFNSWPWWKSLLRDFKEGWIYNVRAPGSFHHLKLWSDFHQHSRPRRVHSALLYWLPLPSQAAPRESQQEISLLPRWP